VVPGRVPVAGLLLVPWGIGIGGAPDLDHAGVVLLTERP
jgi:hypothetical protein